MSHKSVPQEGPTKVARKPLECPTKLFGRKEGSTRVPYKRVAQESFINSVAQACPRRTSRGMSFMSPLKSVKQEFECAHSCSWVPSCSMMVEFSKATFSFEVLSISQQTPSCRTCLAGVLSGSLCLPMVPAMSYNPPTGSTNPSPGS